MNDIAYYPGMDSDNQLNMRFKLPRKIIDKMATSDWVARYGLNYHDAMNLTYHEWVLLCDALKPKEKGEDV